MKFDVLVTGDIRGLETFDNEEDASLFAENIAAEMWDGKVTIVEVPDDPTICSRRYVITISAGCCVYSSVVDHRKMERIPTENRNEWGEVVWEDHCFNC
jgi:hypothetical protein